MNNEARGVIEALRSGIPSKAVGSYFSESRASMMGKIHDKIDSATRGGRSSGMVVVGKYGEGKTHLLNAIDVYASKRNIVVSHVSIGKESPIDKLPVIYSKLLSSTFLPNEAQPGISRALDKIIPDSPEANEMLNFASKSLTTNKLYYVLDAYLRSDNVEERYRLLSDIQGDLLPNSAVRAIAKSLRNEKVIFNTPFAKTKHMQDYFFFASHLFKTLGYDGWVILFDETELMGRLSKRSRMLGYANIYDFIFPDKRLENTFSIFALSASYEEDVIDRKNEYDTAIIDYGEDKRIRVALDCLRKGTKLYPLTKEEMKDVFSKLIAFHASAYEWEPPIDAEKLLKESGSAGFLLRTKIRYAIETLDQLYQYGDEGEAKVADLSKETFEEDMPE